MFLASQSREAISVSRRAVRPWHEAVRDSAYPSRRHLVSKGDRALCAIHQVRVAQAGLREL